VPTHRESFPQTAGSFPGRVRAIRRGPGAAQHRPRTYLSSWRVKSDERQQNTLARRPEQPDHSKITDQIR
jgi:hypothetical protein